MGDNGERVTGDNTGQVTGNNGEQVTGNNGGWVMGNNGEQVTGDNSGRVMGNNSGRVMGNNGRQTMVDGSWVDGWMGHRLTGGQVTGDNGQRVMGNSIVDDSRLRVCNVFMTLTMCHCQTPDNRCGFWSPKPKVNLCHSLPSVSEPALCSPFDSEPTFLIKKLGPNFAHLWSVTRDPN